MPTIYLSNWGGHATVGAHGPNRKFTIMARPRRWEKGEGVVPLLVPDPDAVVAVHEEKMTHEAYREGYLHIVAFRIRRKAMSLKPGKLLAVTHLDPVPVADGDSLLCACSVEKARGGHCHRVWAGAFLVLSGWTVVLDQRELSQDEARALLRPGVPG